MNLPLHRLIWHNGHKKKQRPNQRTSEREKEGGKREKEEKNVRIIHTKEIGKKRTRN